MKDISLLFGSSSAGIGLTSYLSQLAIHLLESGVNVEVLSDPEEQDPGLFKMLMREGIKVHKCPGLSNLSLPFLPSLHKLVATGGYHVVHLYGIQKSSKMWVLRHFRTRLPRFIVNLNSLLLSPDWVASLKNIVAYRIMLNETCDSIVTVSNFLADILSTRYSISRRKIKVIHNGLELDWFDSRAESEPRLELKCAIEALEDKPIVCKVGFLYALKGYEYYLRAAKFVLNQRKDVQFLVVGNGPQLDYLRELARSLGLANNVHFLGRVNYDDIPWLLSKISIGVSTSLMEQFPKALLEFAAATKPIVASDVGDSKEIVLNGVNGCIVPRFDSEATGRHILDLLADAKLAKELGFKGRMRVENEFSMAVMVNRLKNHYRNLIG